MTATDELTRHEQRIAEAQQRVQSLGRDVAKLGARISELKQERISAYADQDERKAGQFSKKIADAQAKHEELDERRAGAELAARRAAGGHQAFVAKRYRDLIGALEPQARNAASKIGDLADRLVTAVKEWEGVKSTVAALAHTAGHHESAPDLGWDGLSQALRRRPKPTPIPLATCGETSSPQWPTPPPGTPSTSPSRSSARFTDVGDSQLAVRDIFHTRHAVGLARVVEPMAPNLELHASRGALKLLAPSTS